MKTRAGRMAALLAVGIVVALFSGLGPAAAQATTSVQTTALITGSVTDPNKYDPPWTMSGSVLGPNPSAGTVTLSDAPVLYPPSYKDPMPLYDVYTLVLNDGSGTSLTASSGELHGTSSALTYPLVAATTFRLRVTEASGSYSGLVDGFVEVKLTGSVPAVHSPLPVGIPGLTSPLPGAALAEIRSV